MEQIDEARLDELGRWQRRRHTQDRLVGKEHRSLGHRIDVAGEAERPEPGHEAGGKLSQAADGVEFVRRERESLEELHSLLEPRRHQEAVM